MEGVGWGGGGTGQITLSEKVAAALQKVIPSARFRPSSMNFLSCYRAL